MAKGKSESSNGDRGPAAYPGNPLDRCLELGAVVRDHGGRDVPRSLIAQAVGLADDSSTFYQWVGSTKCFGIIDGSRELSLTEVGQEYYSAASENGKRLAALQLFSTPSAFKKTVDTFDGKKLPPKPILSSMMQQKFGVPGSWAARAASFFVASAAQVGVIDPNGFLRYGATMHAVSRASTEEAKAHTARPSGSADLVVGAATLSAPAHSFAPPMSNVATSGASHSTSNVWLFAEGTGRLETPDPLPFAVWQKLKAYVDNVLRPVEPKHGGEQ